MTHAYIRMRNLWLAFAVIGLPWALFPAWLSDKQEPALTAASASSSSAAVSNVPAIASSSSAPALAGMRRGFFVPKTENATWPKASLIQAGYDPANDRVLVRWQDTPALNASVDMPRYAVYRGAVLLSSEAKLDTAERIALVPAGVRVYSDTNAPDGQHYYAITIVDKNNTEYFKPEYDQTYTFDAVRVERSVPIVDGLTVGFNSLTRAVLLRWRLPAAANTNLVYAVYQSKTPITALQISAGAEVGRVVHPATNYSVFPAANGNYHYAVVTRNRLGKQSTVFRDGVNRTASPLAVVLPVAADQPVLVRNLTSSFDRNAGILTLNWQYRDANRPGLVIYHNMSAPMSVQGSQKAATPLQVFAPGSTNTSFSLAAAQPGNHFFSIASFSAKKTNELLLPGENATQIPTIVPYPDFVVRRTNYIVEFVTNVRIYNVLQTNTNMYLLFLTNRRTVNMLATNTNIVQVERIVTNDRIVFSDRVLTNTRIVTNEHVVTNERVVTTERIVTNERIVTIDRPDQARVTNETGLRPRPYTDGSDTGSLRREVRSFFGNRDRSNRDGLYANIFNLRRIQAASGSREIETQCTLFIGQAYFELGDYTTAFREFVKLRDSLPDESRGWINRCVERMH